MYIIVFSIALALAFFLLSRAKRLFTFIRPELLRRNIVTYLIGLCFFFSIGHLIPDFAALIRMFGIAYGLLLCAVAVLLNVNIPYNIVVYLTESKRFEHWSALKMQVFIFLSIVLSTMIVNGILKVWLNGNFDSLKYSFLWTFYINGFGSIIYLFIRQSELEKKKKLYEKELELSKLTQLKTRAELDALHAKINPHFLYNALNSIADLTIMDGKKAREMSLALADLFRYSINYSNSNLAAVREELDMVKLYLQIEKIRFEKRLTYVVDVDDDAMVWQIPKFILQPLVENAVKHGLDNIDGCHISITIRSVNGHLSISVADNGPSFPTELKPGYGLQSIFDKLELLFPQKFEVRLLDKPVKQVEIKLYSEKR